MTEAWALTFLGLLLAFLVMTGFAVWLMCHIYDGPWVKYKKEPPSHGWKGEVHVDITAHDDARVVLREMQRQLRNNPGWRNSLR